jgi:hypothetical protein
MAHVAGAHTHQLLTHSQHGLCAATRARPTPLISQPWPPLPELLAGACHACRHRRPAGPQQHPAPSTTPGAQLRRPAPTPRVSISPADTSSCPPPAPAPWSGTRGQLPGSSPSGHLCWSTCHLQPSGGGTVAGAPERACTRRPTRAVKTDTHVRWPVGGYRLGGLDSREGGRGRRAGGLHTRWLIMATVRRAPSPHELVGPLLQRIEAPACARRAADRRECMQAGMPRAAS